MARRKDVSRRLAQMSGDDEPDTSSASSDDEPDSASASSDDEPDSATPESESSGHESPSPRQLRSATRSAAAARPKPVNQTQPHGPRDIEGWSTEAESGDDEEAALIAALEMEAENEAEEAPALEVTSPARENEAERSDDCEAGSSDDEDEFLRALKREEPSEEEDQQEPAPKRPRRDARPKGVERLLKPTAKQPEWGSESQSSKDEAERHEWKTDPITCEALELGKTFSITSPSGQRIVYNASTIKRIAETKGKWLAPPHFRCPPMHVLLLPIRLHLSLTSGRR